MLVVKHRDPVSVFVVETGEFQAFRRGDEVDENSPAGRDRSLSWLFDEQPDNVNVDHVRVEAATRAPGEVRRGRLR